MINVENKLIELGFILKSAIKHNRFVNCSHISKPSKRDSVWYRYDEGKPFVSYGSWNGCIEDGYFFIEEAKPLTPEEKQAYAKKKAEYEEYNRKIEAEDRQRRLTNVRSAYQVTRQTKTSHSYLTRKQIKFRTDFTFDQLGRLVIPMVNIDNQLMGYQYIDDQGNKLFKSGSITKESFYIFKPFDVAIKGLDLIIIAEGIATAGSIYQALDEKLDAVNYGVIATYSAGNVKPVIDVIRTIAPKNRIIGIADNDDAGIKAYNDTNVKFYVCGVESGHDANDIAVQFGEETLAELVIDFIRG